MFCPGNMIDDLKSQLAEDGIINLNIKVRPDAAITKIKNFLDDGTIVIDVAEKAEKGRANRGLVRFISAEFGIPQANVKIINGQTSRRKRLKIEA